MKVSNNQVGKNRSPESAINLQVLSSRKPIRNEPAKAKNDRAMEHQDQDQQNEQNPSDQPEPATAPGSARDFVFIHYGRNLFSTSRKSKSTQKRGEESLTELTEWTE
jgi:hypothetical protein